MTTFAQTNSESLAQRDDDSRLAVYHMLTSACTHLYSKGKLQMGKFEAAVPIFADIARNDPLFMAHLTAWAARNDSKDMKALTIFFNALNIADGTPFYPGSSRNKPNLREVSYSLLQDQDPHLALRILELCHIRFGVPELLNRASHFPTGFKKAFQRYLRYREENSGMLLGARRAGLGQKICQIYRLSHTSPSDAAVSILGWKQKPSDGRAPEVSEKVLPEFENMTSADIAASLTETKLAPTVALSIIPPKKVTVAVAKALLGNCTGNQSVILYNWFAKNGFLDVKSIAALFHTKVQTATTAVDRIETLTREADEEDRKVMVQARAQRRKQQAATHDLGKIFMHIDASISMQDAIDYAKDRASVIAECVTDPQNNFNWGLFGSTSRLIPVPNGFTKDDFHEALFGERATMGSTDCIALYKKAREFGANVDVYLTDQEHNVGGHGTTGIAAMVRRITQYHQSHPDCPKPKAAIIVFFNTRGIRSKGELETALLQCEIPTVVMTPESLTESALVAQSVRTAMIGEMAVIDEIMETPLPKLPRWWNSVSLKRSLTKKNAEVEV